MPSPCRIGVTGRKDYIMFWGKPTINHILYSVEKMCHSLKDCDLVGGILAKYLWIVIQMTAIALCTFMAVWHVFLLTILV